MNPLTWGSYRLGNKGSTHVQISFYIWSLNKVYWLNKNLVEMSSTQYYPSNRKVGWISVCCLFIYWAERLLNFNPSLLLCYNVSSQALTLWLKFCCICSVWKKISHWFRQAHIHTRTGPRDAPFLPRPQLTVLSNLSLFSVSLLKLLMLSFVSDYYTSLPHIWPTKCSLKAKLLPSSYFPS